MRRALASITRMLRPSSLCAFCSHYHPGSSAICSVCSALLIPLPPGCQYCALPLPGGQHPVCGECIKNRPAFDRVRCPLSFEEPLKSIIHDFKFHKALYWSQWLADRIREALPHPLSKPDCLIPVPLHPRRLRERGFNQTVLLANHLGKGLGIPVERRLCTKNFHTEKQTGTSKAFRRTNLRDAFRVKDTVHTHVAIVDDILTTGSTAHALAMALKKKGAETVEVWCVARVTRQKEPT